MDSLTRFDSAGRPSVVSSGSQWGNKSEREFCVSHFASPGNSIPIQQAEGEFHG